MKNKKCIQDSAVTISRIMQPEDANPAGIVHGGAVMKEIDNAAGVAAVRHTRKICVTASIDRLDFHSPCFIGDLLIVKASVNMTGNTSMEIGVRVDTENLLTGNCTHLASAYLTFVALGEDNRPTPIPQVEVLTDEDKRRYNEALARRELRLAEKRKEKENACLMDPSSC